MSSEEFEKDNSQRSEHRSGEHHHHHSGEHHHHHHHSGEHNHHHHHSGEHHHHHHSGEHHHHSGEHHHHHHSGEHRHHESSESSIDLSRFKRLQEQEYEESKPKKSQKKKTALAVIITVICVLTAVVLAGAALLNSVLNKVNYVQPDLKVDPKFEEIVEIPEEHKKADEDTKEKVRSLEIIHDENVVNILLIGTDLGDNAQYFPRSDSMMILSINKNDSTIRLASLSRAVYVSIEGHPSGRLNAAYAYGGPALLIDTIEKNYKIEITNYVSVNFEAFRKIVDIFDGVDIYLTAEEARIIAAQLQHSDSGEWLDNVGDGTYHLEGDAALKYARLRYIDNDRERTGRQRKLLSAIGEKAKNMSFRQLWDISDEVFPLVNTNLTKSDVFNFLSNSLSYLKWDMEQTVIPDKSSNLVLIDNSEVLLVDWTETVTYAQSFFYPEH